MVAALLFVLRFSIFALFKIELEVVSFRHSTVLLRVLLGCCTVGGEVRWVVIRQFLTCFEPIVSGQISKSMIKSTSQSSFILLLFPLLLTLFLCLLVCLCHPLLLYLCLLPDLCLLSFSQTLQSIYLITLFPLLVRLERFLVI